MQIAIQVQDPKWHEPFWYLCGPSSVYIVLAYFKLVKTATIKTIAQNILVDPNTSDGRCTSWMKIISYLENEFGITSEFKATKLTFAEIKKNVDANYPILTGISFILPPNENGETNEIGHIVTIIGYIDPDIVVVNDSFGSEITLRVVNEVAYYNWDNRNAPPSNQPKNNGNQIKYKYSAFSEILGNKWLAFTGIPEK